MHDPVVPEAEAGTSVPRSPREGGIHLNSAATPPFLSDVRGEKSTESAPTASHQDAAGQSNRIHSGGRGSHALPLRTLRCTGPAGAQEPLNEGPSVWLGSGPLHRTHALAFSTDLALWYCTTCGQYAAVAARGLGRVCLGRTYRGAKNLEAITKGEWPQVLPMSPAHARRLEALRTAPAPLPLPAQGQRVEPPRAGEESSSSSGRAGRTGQT